MSPENRTPQNTKTPHAGGENVPADTREVPLREFDNTPLATAVEQHGLSDLTQVETVQDFIGDEKVPTIPTLTQEKAPKKKRTLGMVIGGAATATVLAAGLAFGLGANTNDKDKDNAPQPNDDKVTSEITAEPTPTPVKTLEATESPAPVETVAPTPTPVETVTTPEKPTGPDAETLQRLESYTNLTDQEFNALDKSAQLEWWSWKSQGMKEYADGWYEFSKKRQDQLPVASIDNSAAEISSIAGIQQRYVLALEPAIRNKALTAILYGGMSSVNYPGLSRVYGEIPEAIESPRVAAYKDTMPILDNPKEIERPEPNVSIIQVDEYTNTYTYIEYIDPYTNETTGSWFRH